MTTSPEGPAANKCECGADAEDISFDRRICACGSLHYYCNQCGTRAEPCADERPDAHCEQNAITETSQRGLGYQSGEPAGAVNSGSAPANAATRHRLGGPNAVRGTGGRWHYGVRIRHDDGSVDVSATNEKGETVNAYDCSPYRTTTLARRMGDKRPGYQSVILRFIRLHEGANS